MDTESDEEGRRDAQHQEHTNMNLLDRRANLTTELAENPYDLFVYIKRALVHGDLGYPDLAVGDAYRALLLTDEANEDGQEYYDQATEALQKYLEQPGRLRDIFTTNKEERRQEMEILFSEGHMDQENLLRIARIKCFRILSISLLLCGCLKTAWDFSVQGIAIAPEDQELIQAQEYISGLADRKLRRSDVAPAEFPDQGLVRREIYPWNTHEPDRYSNETLEFLNRELAQVAPKCEAKVTELPTLQDGVPQPDANGNIPTNKQLGLFAKEDIAPGETVLEEVSVLCANNRFHNPLCDCCSSELPTLDERKKGTGAPVECQDCYVPFCSQECHDLAQETYHPAVCEKEVDSIAKQVDRAEIPDMLYFLLLARAIAMAATQEVHPLDLKEVKYIWGDFLPTKSNAVHFSPKAGPPPIWTLPFSFKANILNPLHVLEKMDIDIFADGEKWDLWTCNTLYAKFRGTASSRIGRDGKPEVAAVHPLWCLANHDCDPNVQWEWGGRMRLWARKTRMTKNKAPGIKAGEEILNHYTDIELPVQERREWAAGSLGGYCMCERCRTESAADADAAATAAATTHGDVRMTNGV